MMSAEPAVANRPMRSSAAAETTGSSSATRLGVNTLFTATRSRVCTSPSLSVRFGVNDQPSARICLTSSVSGPTISFTALSDEYVSGSWTTRITSSCRVTTHRLVSPSWRTGHSSRIRAYTGYGSASRLSDVRSNSGTVMGMLRFSRPLPARARRRSDVCDRWPTAWPCPSPRCRSSPRKHRRRTCRARSASPRPGCSPRSAR